MTAVIVLTAVLAILTAILAARISSLETRVRNLETRDQWTRPRRGVYVPPTKRP